MNKYLTVLKKSIVGLNKFEILLLLTILTLTMIGFAMKSEITFNVVISAIAAILGVFCVVLGAKGAMANWS